MPACIAPAPILRKEPGDSNSHAPNVDANNPAVGSPSALERLPQRQGSMAPNVPCSLGSRLTDPGQMRSPGALARTRWFKIGAYDPVLRKRFEIKVNTIKPASNRTTTHLWRGSIQGGAH